MAKRTAPKSKRQFPTQRDAALQDIRAALDKHFPEIARCFEFQARRTGELQAQLDQIRALLKTLVDRE